MKTHHTKNKGDHAVLKAQLDLFEKGYLILTPLSEHEDFDLVAYKEGVFKRIQVKYRNAKDGVIYLEFRSSWADKNGSHSKEINKNNIDFFCIYCPQTDCCYYLNPKNFKTSVALRIEPTISRQGKKINFASNYLEF